MESTMDNAMALAIGDGMVDAMVSSMVDAMASSIFDSIASSTVHAMALSMVGAYGAVYGRRHGPPEMDDAIPWHVPWVPMTCPMDVHRGSNHGVVLGSPWSGRRHESAKYHGMLHDTYHVSMDGAMVHSMEEWSSMASSVASSVVDSMALS